MSRFFIDRPIFASVLTIVILIIGGVALVRLPIAQYPEVAPPTISITANYPGANALDVAENVATPIVIRVNRSPALVPKALCPPKPPKAPASPPPRPR